MGPPPARPGPRARTRLGRPARLAPQAAPRRAAGGEGGKGGGGAGSVGAAPRPVGAARPALPAHAPGPGPAAELRRLRAPAPARGTARAGWAGPGGPGGRLPPGRPALAGKDAARWRASAPGPHQAAGQAGCQGWWGSPPPPPKDAKTRRRELEEEEGRAGRKVELQRAGRGSPWVLGSRGHLPAARPCRVRAHARRRRARPSAWETRAHGPERKPQRKETQGQGSRPSARRRVGTRGHAGQAV